MEYAAHFDTIWQVWYSLMAHSHCTGLALGPGQGTGLGTIALWILLCTVHTTQWQGQGKGTRTIGFHTHFPIPGPGPGPIPVPGPIQCKWAIKLPCTPGNSQAYCPVHFLLIMVFSFFTMINALKQVPLYFSYTQQFVCGVVSCFGLFLQTTTHFDLKFELQWDLLWIR